MIHLSLALSSLFLYSNNQIALGFINTPPILHNNNKHTSAKKSRWTSCYTGSKYSRCISYTIPTTTELLSSPLDDFLGSIFGKDDDKSVNNKEDITDNNTYDTPSGKDEDINEISLSSFQNELAKRSQEEEVPNNDDDEDENEEFDGYALRDCIFAKYGVCFDLEFQRVDSYGFRTVYLNIMPFILGGKRFRHETEFDYLCHLQAVVEILVKYDQLEYVLMQLGETDKKPRGNTSPLIAVPLRLDLTPEQVDKILG